MDIPIGVKVIAVLEYIAAVVLVLGGLAFLLGAGTIAGVMAQMVPGMALLGSGLFVVGGLMLIGLGVLAFFVARGLWQGRNWARIVVIVFAALGVLQSILAILQGQVPVFSLAFNLIVGGYLLFSKDVKEAFG